MAGPARRPRGLTLPDYPPSPWPLSGSLWLTLFQVGWRVQGAAFVVYEEPSPLTYAELLVARPVVVGHRPRVSISDIWVDSPASVDGGRALWAIPKGLASFRRDSSRSGRVTTTSWTATLEGRQVAQARFRDVSGSAPRLPFRGTVWQPGLPETGGVERTAPVRGTARTLPARAEWEVAPDGPLGRLAGARQLGSFRVADFEMTFGR